MKSLNAPAKIWKSQFTLTYICQIVPSLHHLVVVCRPRVLTLLLVSALPLIWSEYPKNSKHTHKQTKYNSNVRITKHLKMMMNHSVPLSGQSNVISDAKTKPNRTEKWKWNEPKKNKPIHISLCACVFDTLLYAKYKRIFGSFVPFPIRRRHKIIIVWKRTIWNWNW